MTPFDSDLRRGLMDANLAQYERLLKTANSAEMDFSPSYLRERTRLLADPWGWVKRRERPGPRRMNWRLIAIAAALLLLSACAVAVVTGQFSQWFPTIRMDPKAPEVSEEIVSRMGTVIGEPQTVDGASVTLNAAVWDGQELRLSLTAEVPDLPEDFSSEAPFYDLECRLRLAEDQREAYLRKEIARSHANSHIDLTEEELEELVQSHLEYPDDPDFHSVVRAARQEDGTLILQVMAALFDYVEDPELTLHIENLATYKVEEGDDGIFTSSQAPDGTVTTDHEINDPFLKGPFDFTFTLDKKLSPISYE